MNDVLVEWLDLHPLRTAAALRCCLEALGPAVSSPGLDHPAGMQLLIEAPDEPVGQHLRASVWLRGCVARSGRAAGD